MLKACEIRECGAMVMVVTVEGQPFAVNPKRLELVVEDGSGGHQIVLGFEPHRNSCVNIGDRVAHRGSHRGSHRGPHQK